MRFDARQCHTGAVFGANSLAERRGGVAHTLIGAGARDGGGEIPNAELSPADRWRRHTKCMKACAPELLIESKWHDHRWNAAPYSGSRRTGTAVMYDRAAARIEPRVGGVLLHVSP